MQAVIFILFCRYVLIDHIFSFNLNSLPQWWFQLLLRHNLLCKFIMFGIILIRLNSILKVKAKSLKTNWMKCTFYWIKIADQEKPQKELQQFIFISKAFYCFGFQFDFHCLSLLSSEPWALNPDVKAVIQPFSNKCTSVFRHGLRLGYVGWSHPCSCSKWQK